MKHTIVRLAPIVLFTVLAGIPAGYPEVAGNLDLSFLPQELEGGVNAMAFDGNGRLYVAGSFLKGLTNGGLFFYQGLARLRPDGLIDTTFRASGMFRNVKSLVVQDDGKIVLGGTAFENPDPLMRLDAIVRLNPDGSKDPTFVLGDGTNDLSQAAVTVWRVQKQHGGKLLIAGNFRKIDGISISGVARLHPDGILDRTFTPDTRHGEVISELLLQPDGKLILWSQGVIEFGQAVISRGLIRLNADGSLDTLFKPDPRTRHPIALQPNGQLLATLYPTNFNPRTQSAKVLRLNTDGSIDAEFEASVASADQRSWALRQILVQPDSKIILAGDFRQVNGLDRRDMAQLNSDGTLDTNSHFGIGTGFVTDLGGGSGPAPINALLLQENGYLLVAGHFYEVNGTPIMSLARFYRHALLRFTSAAIREGGLFECLLHPHATSSVQIESSSDLRDWTPAAAVTEANGVVQYSEAHRERAQRFFRAIRR